MKYFISYQKIFIVDLNFESELERDIQIVNSIQWNFELEILIDQFSSWNHEKNT